MNRCKRILDECRNVNAAGPMVTYLSENEQGNASDARSWKRRRLLPWCLHGPDADWVKENAASETSRSQKFSAKFHGRRRPSGADAQLNPLGRGLNSLAHVSAGEGADLCAVGPSLNAPEVGHEKMPRILSVEGYPRFRFGVIFFGFCY